MNSILLLLSIFSATEAVSTGFPAWSKGVIQFVVDRCDYYRGDSLIQAEFYFMVDPKTVGPGAQSLEIAVELQNEQGQVSRDQWTRRISEKTPGTIVDYFQIYLKPGTYALRLVLQTDQGQSGTVERTFTVQPRDSTLSLSDLELAVRFLSDSTNPFYKHGVAVIPNPSHTYRPTQRETLRVYYEVYGMQPDSQSVVLNHLIQDTTGQILLRLPPRPVAKAGRGSMPWATELPLTDLKPGVYDLLVQAVDLSTGQQALRTVRFVYSPKQGFTVDLPEEWLPYLEFIDYFASEDQIAMLKTLEGEGKRYFLYTFWKRYDPNPETPKNEFLPEFIERVKYADEHFSFGKKLGRYTDRGRIYIRYGPPDQIEHKYQEWGRKDVEKWIYYQRGQMEFIFMDFEMSGDYQLIYSSIPEEPSRQDWRQLLREEEFDW